MGIWPHPISPLFFPDCWHFFPLTSSETCLFYVVPSTTVTHCHITIWYCPQSTCHYLFIYLSIYILSHPFPSSPEQCLLCLSCLFLYSQDSEHSWQSVDICWMTMWDPILEIRKLRSGFQFFALLSPSTWKSPVISLFFFFPPKLSPTHSSRPGSAPSILQTKPSLQPVHVNRFYWNKIIPIDLFTCESMPHLSWIIVAETVWFSKLKIFTICLYRKVIPPLF